MDGADVSARPAGELPRAAPRRTDIPLARIHAWGDDRARRLEAAGPILFAVLSLVYLLPTMVIAARKLMWNDELYTFYIARLPSMADVWMALASRGEQTPPFFYVLTRLSLGAFGVSGLTIRLPEILGFWLMCACLFVFVRRRAAASAALCAAALPLVTMAYFYAYEARPYGLVLGFGALALVAWQSAALGQRRGLSIIGLALALGATVSAHYYGVFVVAALAAGEAVRAASSRRLDVPVWIALVAPAIPLALHLPLIRAGAAYSGAFWAIPRWVNIPDFYTYLLGPAVVPLAAILVVAALYAVTIGPQRRDGVPSAAPPAPPVHEIAAACAFVTIPFLAVFLAKVATGAFTHRYALPAILGFCVLGGFGMGRVARRHSLLALVTAGCLVGWFVLAQGREIVQPTGMSQPVTQQLIDRPADWLHAVPRTDLPLVVADPHNFTVLSHYGAPEVRERMVYLADPALALKHLGHNSVERGMLDLIGPWFGMRVVEFEPFLAGHDEFLIYGDFIRLGFLNWIVPELQARGMRLELLNRGGDNLFLLARGGPAVPRPSR